MGARRVCWGIAAVAFCLAGEAAAHCADNCFWTAELTQAYVFGDNLSDGGQYGARYTTNPGLTAAMYLAGSYGLSATPSTLGGTNYAFGGARIVEASPFVPVGEPQMPISAQITAFINMRPVDVRALYVLQGGGNDILALSQASAAGQLTSAQVQTAVARAANDLAAQLLRLWTAGARHFVVFNLPDLGKTPLAAAMNAQATLSGLSGLFNSTLDAALAAYQIDIVSVNASALLSEIIANPSVFGFQNATTPACTSMVNGQISSLACTPATLRQPNAAETYVFADDVNFTTRTNRIMAQYAASIIMAPEQIVLLGEAPLQIAHAQLRVYDGRVHAAELGRRGTVETYGAVDFGNATIGATASNLSSSSDIASLVIGADTTLGRDFVAGLAFGYSETKGSFGESRGGFKLNESLLTGYVYTRHEPWYAGVAFIVAPSLEFKHIERNIELGDATRTERGDTTGTHFGWHLNGGWEFVAGNWTHGPVASIGYQSVVVKAYEEQGTSSTAMLFGHQKRESTLATIGWQVRGALNMADTPVRPWALVQGAFELHRPHDRSLQAGLVTVSTTFYGSTFRPPGDNHLEVNAGVSAEFSRMVSGFLSVGVIPERDNRTYGATVGLKVAL